jgi:predicted metal-dependent hydrolase
MNALVIFGREYKPTKKSAGEDVIQKKLSKLTTSSKGENQARLIKEFLTDLLHSELSDIYDQVRDESKIDVFGNLDFEVADTIDKRRHRIAKIKENRIIVKLNAVSLPRSALKYIVAHEMAHLITKKHGKKFWKIVESIYPGFEEGQKAFMSNEKILKMPLYLSFA